MEETLGKRIARHRRALGMTQDQLAEKLGVTAQAVSKWENDQSCPDIATLPRLAEIFGTSVDALLGRAPDTAAKQGEVAEDSEKGDDHHGGRNWEFKWESGRRGWLAFAVWVLLTGGLLLLSNLLELGAGFWDILWPTCLLVFGIAWLYPKFSFLNLGIALVGGYFLLDNLALLPATLDRDLLFPILLVLFGVSLLVDALRKPRKPFVSSTFVRKDQKDQEGNKVVRDYCDGDTDFDYSLAFAEDTHAVSLPLLTGGEASVAFGNLTLDLQDCQSVSERCTIEATCAFGVLYLLVPKRFQVKPTSSTFLSSLDIMGEPDPDAAETIYLDASVSFGKIEVRYV
ncbi:MAG: helix-turn-helix domain-containing protein [Firmicutes bacterium]|nr:helix-turn-helix domain-containing protein [Bacillota bacterium]